MFTPGQKVNWMYQQRGGYGFIIPIKAEVVRTTGKRVIIKVWRVVDGEAVERTVKPESLRTQQ